MIREKSNRGFTLVELLSVIVILAIILVIAVPKIMSVINSSKKSTLETSAKMIASSAEKIKLQNKLLGKENDEITCDSVAKLSNKDYSNCTITFNNNEAIVSINGIGKFNGINVCNATKNNATSSEDKCPTDGRFFTYDTNIDEDAFVYSAEVIDMEKCINFMVNVWDYSNEKAQATCNNDVENGNGWNLQQNASNILFYGISKYGYISSIEEAGLKGTYKKITNVEITNKDSCITYLINKWGEDDYDEYIEPYCSGGTDSDGDSIDYNIRTGSIPVTDFETAGLNVSLENSETAIITGYDISGGENVVIPKEIDGYKVDEILNYAFYNENIKSIEVPKTITKINDCAFGDKTRLTSSNISSSYTCNNKPTNGALTIINKLGDNDILNSYAQYNDTTYHAGIRYTGSDPDNYVYFNCDDEKDTSTCEIWRIIGVFNVDGEKRIKIINTSSILYGSYGGGSNQWSPSTYENGDVYEGSELYQLLNGYYIDQSDSCTYEATNPDTYEKYICNNENLTNKNMKPLTISAKKVINPATWYSYGVFYDNGCNGLFYSWFYSYGYSKNYFKYAYLQENGINYQNKSNEYFGKKNGDDGIIRTTENVDWVGLASLSDHLFANGWLNFKEMYNPIALITPRTGVYDNLYWTGNNNEESGASHSYEWNYNYIFPSVYLKSNVNLNGTGDDLGSIDNPYTLSID